MGKRIAQKATIIDTTSDSQVNSQQFPIQVVTGYNILQLFLPISIFIYNENNYK